MSFKKLAIVFYLATAAGLFGHCANAAKLRRSSYDTDDAVSARERRLSSDDDGNRAKYYEVVYQEVPFHYALNQCERKGKRLASITSKAENDRVAELCYKTGYKECWVGLIRNADKWLDGSPLSYENWNNYGVGGGRQSFVTISGGLYSNMPKGTWRYRWPTDFRPFICG